MLTRFDVMVGYIFVTQYIYLYLYLYICVCNNLYVYMYMYIYICVFMCEMNCWDCH